MDLIITVAEFAEYRNISKKIDNDKTLESIGQAQQSDLIDILGSFYFDVLKNKDVPEYEDLMNGSEFTYCDEVFVHEGVKRLLADYVYSRYVYKQNVNDTPFGLQEKFTQDSKGIDRNYIKDISKQSQIDAGVKFVFIEKYILSKPELFSRYCDGSKQNTSSFTQRFSKL